MLNFIIFRKCFYLIILSVIVLSSISQANANDQLIQRYEQAIKNHYNYGETEQAVVVAREYLSYTQRKYGAVSKATVAALRALGQSYFSDGRYEDAEKAYSTALTTDEKIVGASHKDLVPHLEALASVYDALLRFEDARILRVRIDKIIR